MLLDREGHQLNLATSPNRHILVLGGSGQGKTFFCCQRIKEEIAKRRRVLVYDFSGSYREEELRKAGLEQQKIQFLNPCKESCAFIIKAEKGMKFQKNIAGVLTNVLGIRGYLQKTVLTRAVAVHMKDNSVFSFDRFYGTLERLYEEKREEEERRDERAALLKLLERLEPYSDIENVNILCTDEKRTEKITIVQLSDFPEQQRHFLTEFLLGMFWTEVMSGVRVGYNTILLDEFQHLSMSGNGTLVKLLREGRRFGISLILATQFIGNYDKSEQETILQAGNKLLFKPVAKDRRAYVEMIGEGSAKTWSAILNDLQVGEAVLVGNYTMENQSRIWQTPLVCQVKKSLLIHSHPPRTEDFQYEQVRNLY